MLGELEKIACPKNVRGYTPIMRFPDIQAFWLQLFLDILVWTVEICRLTSADLHCGQVYSFFSNTSRRRLSTKGVWQDSHTNS